MPYPCISIYQARVELLLSCFVESPGRRFHLESKQRQRGGTIGYEEDKLILDPIRSQSILWENVKLPPDVAIDCCTSEIELLRLTSLAHAIQQDGRAPSSLSIMPQNTLLLLICSVQHV